MEVKKKLGELPADQVEALKAQYPGLRTAEFEHDDDGRVAVVYLRKLTRQEYVNGNKYSEKDVLTCAEFLLKNIQVGGYDKEEIIKDIDWLKNCAVTILPVLFVNPGTLKKN